MARRAVKRRSVRKTSGRRKLQQNGAIVARDAAGRFARAGAVVGVARGAYYAGRALGNAYRMANRAIARSNERTARLNQKRASRVTAKSWTGTMEKKRVRVVFGRKSGNQNMRMLNAMQNRLRLTFRGLLRQDQLAATAVAGFFPMRNTLGNAEGATSTSGVAPVYVLSLNNTVQNGVYSSPFRRMEVNANGAISFNIVSGQNPTTLAGTALSTWVNEAFNSGADPGGECNYVCNEWVQVRMVLYGARTQATRYQIHLVQCHDVDAAIEDTAELFAEVDTPVTQRRKDMVASYWLNMIRPLVTTDIAGTILARKPRNSGYGPFRTLRTWSYNIAPHMTTESDTTPNSVVANLFLHDHRVLNYCWEQQASAYDPARTGATNAMDDLLVQPYYQFDSTRTDNPPLDNPHPRARRYLVITCNNTTPVAAASETSDNTPSIDLYVRKSEVRGQNTAA